MNSEISGSAPEEALGKALNEAATAIQQNRIAHANTLLLNLLEDHPDNQMILHLLGMCQRKSDQLDQAIQTQRGLLQKNPDFAAGYQELGLCLRLKGQRREAMDAFRLATEKDPRMVNSWKFFGDMASVLGEEALAIHAYSQYPAETEDDPMLARAIELIDGKQLGPADLVIRLYLRRYPTDAKALYNQSRIAMAVGALTDAIDLLEKTLEHAPGDQQARLDYTNLLSRRQRYDEALVQVKKLLKAEPAHAGYRMLHAAMLERSGQYESALAVLQRLLKEDSGNAEVWTRTATLQRILGQPADAITSLHKAIDCDHDRGEPWYLLADMKTVPFTDGQIEALRGSVDRVPKNSSDEVHFSFALARALESRGKVEESFSYYQRGNATRNRIANYDSGQQAAYFTALKEATAPDVFEDLPDAGHPDASPIFIVGLPRSGSTLVEQIITQHSQV
ncbi:MAG TPA: tetratricopeptide repeat protein, partial [Xanthomonadales bacterium]|nr:tetratricopeptide repeat protein [Xanthomonadales bacterium]